MIVAFTGHRPDKLGGVLGHDVFHPVSAWPRCHERGWVFKWEVSR